LGREARLSASLADHALHAFEDMPDAHTRLDVHLGPFSALRGNPTRSTPALQCLLIHTDSIKSGFLPTKGL
jgi:hypothetical protein